MNKKSLIALMTVTLMIVTFGPVGPAGAKQPFKKMRTVFKADIVPAGTADTQTLEKGEVYIRVGGNFKVKIKGAEVDDVEVATKYGVYLLFEAPETPGTPGTAGTPSIYLGDLDTDEEGDGKLEGDGLCFGDGGFVGNPWIEIRLGDEVQFVSGFELDQCATPPSPPSPPNPPSFPSY